MELSEDFKDVFTHAEIQAHASGRDRVDVTHLFSAILSLEDSFAVYYVMRQGTDILEILGSMSRESIGRDRENEMTFDYADDDFFFNEEDGWMIDEKSQKKQTGKWQQYVECMNDTCKNKNPLIGRERHNSYNSVVFDIRIVLDTKIRCDFFRLYRWFCIAYLQ